MGLKPCSWCVSFEREGGNKGLDTWHLYARFGHLWSLGLGTDRYSEVVTCSWLVVPHFATRYVWGGGADTCLFALSQKLLRDKSGTSETNTCITDAGTLWLLIFPGGLLPQTQVSYSNVLLCSRVGVLYVICLFFFIPVESLAISLYTHVPKPWLK